MYSSTPRSLATRSLTAYYVMLAALAVVCALGVMACFSAPPVLHAQSNRSGAFPVRASALSTTVLVVSTGPSIIDTIDCQNPNASAAYLQLFNTKATVTLGTTTPTWAVSLPNSGHVTLSGINLLFGNGVAVAATTTATGNTGLGAALDCNFGTR